MASIWWMYDGYVWLTGNVRLELRIVRVAIFVAMGGYLLMALAISGVFGETELAPGDTAVVFGIGSPGRRHPPHGAVLDRPQLFRCSNPAHRPFQPRVRGAGVVRACVDEDSRWILWTIGLLGVLSTTLIGRHRGFAISSAHFIERHGLVIIVALGESVVAIGVGASGLVLDGARAPSQRCSPWH